VADTYDHTVVLQIPPGELLDDRWRLEGRIGQGAMGSVFRGRDVDTGTVVAIKILSPEHCRKPKVLARFEREAELMTTLSHPNLVKVYGHGRRGALPYIVLEYLEGMTLADALVQKGGTLSAAEAVAVVKPIAQGLAFLHEHGLVHRDVKPQNIFLSAGGKVTILDLGVVRDQQNPGLTRPGAMVGTPYYMSPEQILGQDIDRRTDVYALAAMTFEVLTGRPPFLGDNNFEVLYAHKHSPPPDASLLSRRVPREVAEVVSRAMSKDREQRPDSALRFAEDLEAAAGARRAELTKAFAFLEKRQTLSEAGDREGAWVRSEPTRIIRRRKTTDEVPVASDDDVHSISNLHPVGDQPTPRRGQRSWTRAANRGPAQTADYDASRLDTRDGLPPVASRETRDDPTAAGVPGEETTGPQEGLTEAVALPGDAAAAGMLRVMALVKGRPATALLTVDGVANGITPRSLAAPAGPHLVRLELDGYQPLERTVDVTAGGTTYLRLELVPE